MISLRVASFFSGIGGFELGLERAGHRCVWACEIDPFARAVFEARFGRKPVEDITRVAPDDIPDADLWCGGFPCQDLSTAGKRAGLGEGTRSGLVFDFLELARVRKPEWLLLENVPGLLSGRDDTDGDVEPDREAVGETAGDATWLGTLLGALEELGYVGAWRVLDARYFGVPQRRRRVFILARRAGNGGGGHPASLLLEPEGVRGSAPTSGTPGPRVAHAVTARAGKGVSQRDGDGDGDIVLASSVTASAGHHGFSSPRGDGSDNLIASPLGCPSPNGGTRQDPWDGGGALVAATLTSGGHPNSNAPGRHAEDDVNLVPLAFNMAQVTHPENRSRCAPGDPAPTLAASGEPAHVAYHVNSAHSCAKKDHAFESDHARALDTTGGFASGQGGTVIAFDWTKDSHGHGASEEATHALGAHRSKQDAIVVPLDMSKPRASTATGAGTPATGVGEPGDPAYCVNAQGAVQGVATIAAVRRLTPRECERLQGLPDDWTLIDGASDARRYKAIGNAVAVPVIEWIGRRLASEVSP